MFTLSRLWCLGMILLGATMLAGATSLWSANSKALTIDSRARAVGDLLTVIIAQQSSSSTGAKHATAKNLTVGGGPGKGLLNIFPQVSVKADRSTSGTGSATSNTTILDRITVTVTEVLPNGTMKIAGSRLIKMEKDTIVLEFSGVVRQQDVTNDNTISSTLVADQVLVSKGAGPIAEKVRPGLISRLLNFLW